MQEKNYPSSCAKIIHASRLRKMLTILKDNASVDIQNESITIKKKKKKRTHSHITWNKQNNKHLTSRPGHIHNKGQ